LVFSSFLFFRLYSIFLQFFGITIYSSFASLPSSCIFLSTRPSLVLVLQDSFLLAGEQAGIPPRMCVFRWLVCVSPFVLDQNANKPMSQKC